MKAHKFDFFTSISSNEDLQILATIIYFCNAIKVIKETSCKLQHRSTYSHLDCCFKLHRPACVVEPGVYRTGRCRRCCT